MSIGLAQEQVTTSSVAMLAALAAVAVGALAISGFFGRRDEQVIRRLYTRDSLSPLLWNIAIAVGVYLGSSIAITLVLRFKDPELFNQALQQGFPPKILILLSCVVPAATLAGMLIGLRTIVPNGLKRLGLEGRPIGGAIPRAIGIIVAAIPLVMFVSSLTEILYQRLGWPHDAHDLLKSMSATGSMLEKI